MMLSVSYSVQYVCSESYRKKLKREQGVIEGNGVLA